MGRGSGSGLGGTSGKGHKGQKARSGGGTAPWFEGGQMPLQRRIPKRGFKNPFKVRYAVVNVGVLDQFPAGTEIGPDEMMITGIVRKAYDGIKLLADGDITRALTVRVHKASPAAVSKIEAAGGKVELISSETSEN